MSNFFSTNNFVPFAGGYSNAVSGGFTDQMFYAWKNFMVANAGWKVVASGDGLSSFSISGETGGDIFTSIGTGAGGFSNFKSWFIIREPSPGYAGSRREFLVVKYNGSGSTSGGGRYIAYSQQGFIQQPHIDGQVTKVSSGTVTFTSTSMVLPSIGQSITISGATNSGNNGTFVITGNSTNVSTIKDNNTITFTNSNAVVESPLTWYIIPQTVATGFGHSNNSTGNITAQNPPIAFDEIVISSWYSTAILITLQSQGFFNYDLANLNDDFYTTYSGSHGWNYYIWNGINLEVGFPGLFYSFYASSTAPFSFYILISTADVVSSNGFIKNKIVKFFAFDELLEYTTNHTDPVVVTKMNSFGQQGTGNASITDFTKGDSTPAYLASGAWESKTLFNSKQDALNKTSIYNSDSYAPARILNSFSNLSSPLRQDKSFKDTVMPAHYFTVGKAVSYLGKSSIVKVINQQKEGMMTVKVNTSKDYVVITNDGFYNSIGNAQGLIVPWDGSNILY